MKEGDEDEEEYDRMAMRKEYKTIFNCIIVPISTVFKFQYPLYCSVKLSHYCE